MKRYFDAATRYCKKSSWKTLAALKLCLLALGVLIGVLLPDSWRILIVVVCAVVYAVTCVPLLARYFRILRQR